jgi:hypothetical protein
MLHELKVNPACPLELQLDNKKILDWELEEQEIEVQVTECNCEEWLHNCKEHKFWSSTDLVIGKDMAEEIVNCAGNLMFLQPPKNWVMVQDGGKSNEKDPSETPK